MLTITLVAIGATLFGVVIGVFVTLWAVEHRLERNAADVEHMMRNFRCGHCGQRK